MEVRFSQGFLKYLQKQFSKVQALSKVRKLSKTQPSDGKVIAVVKSVVLKEIKDGSFRFYFVFEKGRLEIMNKNELDQRILQFIALSKKNNQQKVIDDLKKDLDRFFGTGLL